MIYKYININSLTTVQLRKNGCKIDSGLVSANNAIAEPITCLLTMGLAFFHYKWCFEQLSISCGLTSTVLNHTLLSLWVRSLCILSLAKENRSILYSKKNLELLNSITLILPTCTLWL